ncbi:MAG: hypothetical protein AUJ52_08970 [Elusimicrobia bacterium CG1_02_63_36]|nr:MAG: hypothetical protein AUJ52_08970 [Elusimicrobia bacterium CG1_02_63_36]PIP83146.1 MAG: glycosyl hydrolase [Elusimicrobia bacterium CG22_combo_CG10-13_8_21_14_all_63_91]PJA17402.1 MAG: glycosyl hydrolase [Elusimicrobia bacterium CG_4_10_14_0_2_um_filter_63_34]PJB23593.1 MAG: glycosyl hydrolase [Elusimicrobia bacterium CG_4_9_14_3_um_filter_62_55]
MELKPTHALVFGVPGPILDAQTRRIIEDVRPGGFILFSRNIQEPRQLRELIDGLRDACDVEPVITIDQEGGRVSRLKELGQEPPHAVQLRDVGDLELMERHGALTGRLLRLFGFNLDLCPVLDIAFNDDAENSLRGRTWGRTAGEVARNAGVFLDAMRAEGILGCGKHFPGYSGAAVDPHYALPTVDRAPDDLLANEWAPYAALRERLDCVMMGHALYPKVDASGLPASLSRAMIEGELRGRLKFPGWVVSDDLDMGAITGKWSLGESVRLAAEAGTDLILICHRMKLAAEAANGVSKASVDLKRQAALRAKLAPPEPFSLEAFRETDAEIGQLREAVLAKGAGRVESKASHSPVEDF